MRSVDSYSELECLILGLIALGAKSGYAMRKSMQRMRGNRFSVESGSIYRALKRLEVDQMVRVRARVGIPNRQRIEYELMPTGEMVLQSWIQRTPEVSEFEHISDPIRTRSYFLELVDPSTRLQILRSWLIENRKVLDVLKEETTQQEHSEDLPAHALKSLLGQTKARHDWLRQIHDQLKLEVVKRPLQDRSTEVSGE